MSTGRNIRSGSRERGIAFILVLWVIAMLALLLGSFSLIARTENLQSRHLFDTTQARYAAEAGLDLAVFELRKPDPNQRWVADGRPYRFAYGDAELEVSITDDSGKIDINTANAELLTSMFMTRGVPIDKAQALADAVVDWRDPDDMEQPNGAEAPEYKAAGLSYTPKNAPFDTVSELQQVLGMSYPLFEKLEPGLTIYSGRGTPNGGYGNDIALQALYPDAAPEQIQQLIEQLHAQPPGAPAGTVLAPDGSPIMASGGGLTYSVKSRAKLPNGASTVLDATIRMGGINAAGRPYVILRWRDGEAS